MANTMTYRTLLSLLQQLSDEELNCEVNSHMNEDGIWCYPHGILVGRVNDTLEVTLDDGLEESAQGRVNRTPPKVFDVQHIANLLDEWGCTLEQHSTKTDDGGWYVKGPNSREVQFNCYGVMMQEDSVWNFDPSEIEDKHFAGIIYAQLIS